MLKEGNIKRNAKITPSSFTGVLKRVHLFPVLGAKEKVGFLSLRAAFEVRGTKTWKRVTAVCCFIAVQWAFHEYLLWAQHYNRCSGLKQGILEVINKRLLIPTCGYFHSSLLKFLDNSFFILFLTSALPSQQLITLPSPQEPAHL